MSELKYFLLVFTLFTPIRLVAQYELPYDYISSAVLINVNDGDSFGSGTLYSDTANVYLITAKHVLFPIGVESKTKGKIKLVAYCKNPLEIDSLKKEIMIIDIEKSYKSSYLKVHPERDVAIIKIGSVDSKNQSRITWSNNFQWEKKSPSSSVVTLRSDNMSLFKEVGITRDVFVFGYPKTIGLEKNPQYDFEAPLIQKGIISAKDKNRKTFILNCSVYGGNSGGPVFQISDFGRKVSLIGLIIEHIPYISEFNGLETNSGYSVGISFDYVLDVMRRFTSVSNDK